MHYQLPSLEHECITALLRHSNYVKAALQEIIPGELRTQIIRRVIVDGKVTAMRTALKTWPEEMLAIGDLCCSERLLFDHGCDSEVDDILPQVLRYSLGPIEQQPPHFDPEGIPLSLAFICARFLEMTLTERPGKLRHLDLTYYGMMSLPEIEPILDALYEINSTDAAAGHVFHDPFTLSVGVAVSSSYSGRVDAATVQLGRLLEKQAQRPVRCILRITGLFSGEVELQKRARKLLRLLAQHNCPLEVLIANGTSDWSKGEQAVLVEKFSNLRLVGLGACESFFRPRLRLPVPVPNLLPNEPTEVPRQYHVRSLVLSGCKSSLVRRVKKACLPSGWLQSLSVSASLLNLFTQEELSHLYRLSIVGGHGPAHRRPERMDQFLRGLRHLALLQLLTIYDPLTEGQIRLLAAGLPAMPELRFCRFRTPVIRPLGALVALGLGAKLTPQLRALHVKLEREPLPEEAKSFSQLVECLRYRLGQPERDNVCFYLTEAALPEWDMLDQMRFIPL